MRDRRAVSGPPIGVLLRNTFITTALYMGKGLRSNGLGGSSWPKPQPSVRLPGSHFNRESSQQELISAFIRLPLFHHTPVAFVDQLPIKVVEFLQHSVLFPFIEQIHAGEKEVLVLFLDMAGIEPNQIPQ